MVESGAYFDNDKIIFKYKISTHTHISKTIFNRKKY